MTRSRNAIIVTAAAVIVLMTAAVVISYLVSEGASAQPGCPAPTSARAAGSPVSGPYRTPNTGYWTSQRMRDVHGHENQQGGCG